MHRALLNPERHCRSQSSAQLSEALLRRIRPASAPQWALTALGLAARAQAQPRGVCGVGRPRPACGHMRCATRTSSHPRARRSCSASSGSCPSWPPRSRGDTTRSVPPHAHCLLLSRAQCARPSRAQITPLRWPLALDPPFWTLPRGPSIPCFQLAARHPTDSLLGSQGAHGPLSAFPSCALPLCSEPPTSRPPSLAGGTLPRVLRCAGGAGSRSCAGQ